jgi:hypothetical protein
MPTPVRPLRRVCPFTNLANFTYSGATESLIAAITASWMRFWSSAEIVLGNFFRLWAKGDFSGSVCAIPSACGTTFSRRNFGGMRPSAMPRRMWSIVSSICFGKFFNRVT